MRTILALWVWMAWPLNVGFAADIAQVYSTACQGPVGTSYPEWSSSVISYVSKGNPPGSGTLPSPVITNTLSPNGAARFLGLFGGPPIGVPGNPGYNRTRVDQ